MIKVRKFNEKGIHSMKAQMIREVGAPSVFQIEEIEKPAVGSGQVLIRVHATSVNPIDTKVRAGIVAAAPAFPAILHGDVAGTIEAVGEGVTQFEVGDEVYGCAGGFKGLPGGALAEYMLTEPSLIAHKPKNLTMEQAAAIPLVAITAWEALFQRAKLKAGDSILVHAATGGVGHVAIQLAKWAGATVYTTASSPEKCAIGKQLGADYAINYKEQSVQQYVDYFTEGKGFDIVFDTVGGENLDRAFEAAALNGQVLAIAARSTHDLSILHAKGLSLHVTFMMLKLLNKELHERCTQILQEVTQVIEQGALVPLIDARTFTFNEVAEAHELLQSGQAMGKIVLRNTWIA